MKIHTLHTTKYTTMKLLATLILTFTFSYSSFSQHLSQGWTLLNGQNLFAAIKHFEKAAKSPKTEEEALLALAMLYARVDRKDDAADAFRKYYDTAADPLPATYALYYSEAVVGAHRERTAKNKEMLSLLSEDPKAQQTIGHSVQYNLAMNALFDNEPESYKTHIEDIGVLKSWSITGPFDNVMNSGYDKTTEALNNPKDDASFTSRYGGKVGWYKPTIDTEDGFLSMGSYFSSSASKMYAQTFVTVASDTDITIHLGYSGVVRLWLNDQEVYADRETRVTAAGDLKINTTISKGANRILVQLGSFQSQNSNFSIALSDRNNQPLTYQEDATYISYVKPTNVPAELQPHFAISSLLEKYDKKPSDVLNLILLAKAYRRQKDLNAAEKYLKMAEQLAPLNYLVVRELNLLYDSKGNNSEVSKYYQILKEKYPDDYDIFNSRLEEYADQGKNEELRKEISRFKKMYQSPISQYSADIKIATLDEDYMKLISMMDEMYASNPSNADFANGKYQVSKAMGGGDEATKVLEDYLVDYYDYSIMTTLANVYLGDGKIDEAIALYEKSLELSNQDAKLYYKIKEAYDKQEKFDKSAEVLNKLLESRPTDADIYDDLSTLYNIKKDKKAALANYQKSLEYYPFDFMLNEKRREAIGKKTLLSYVAEIDPIAVIKEYEKNLDDGDTRSADIVYHNKTRILNEWGAYAIKESYIMKINQESALEDYQKMQFESSSQTRVKVIDVQTIKQNGNRISAEAHGSERVFMNLEAKDYIYVSYVESQTRGSKTSVFQYDTYGFDSYLPSYNRDFVLITEEADAMVFATPSGEFKPKVTKKDGLHFYTWSLAKPQLLKDEPYTVPYNDFATNVQVSSNHTWNEIVTWYRDLSNEQARQDYTIKELVQELKLPSLTDDIEKAKVIYDFIVQNIQYSSIDFRQSNYVPQLASDVYHTRLGDCKDVSTLFAALGREVGLEVNLVLINTSDNGTNDIVMPSLNFNHCIVQLVTEQGPIYLELTDPDLPFGHLYAIHHMASILVIPYKEGVESKLTKLTHNKGYLNNSSRKSQISITNDNSVDVKTTVEQSGSLAAMVAYTYLDKDPTTLKETVEGWLSSLYKGTLRLGKTDFSRLKKTNSMASYDLEYSMDSYLIKVGSFHTLKLPFHEVIAYASDFQTEKRSTPLDYKFYENADEYHETIELSIDGDRKFLEVPENVALTCQGNSYELNFDQISDNKMKVSRTYKSSREVVLPQDYEAFRSFILKVVEAEETHLIVK